MKFHVPAIKVVTPKPETTDRQDNQSCTKPWVLPGPFHRGLTVMRTFLNCFPSGNELIILRDWPKKARFPANICYAPLDSICKACAASKVKNGTNNSLIAVYSKPRVKNTTQGLNIAQY